MKYVLVLTFILSADCISGDTISTKELFHLRFDIHETFLSAVQLSPDIKMLLTQGRNAERMVYLAHHDGRTQKFNVTALQYGAHQKRQTASEMPQGLSTRLASQRILQGDFNHNGKLDVAYVSSTYEELIAAISDTRDSAKKIEWGGYECGNFDVLLSLDDMTQNILIHFDDGQKLDIGGKYAVLVEKHSEALRSTAPLNQELWRMLKKDILNEKTEFGCMQYYDDMYTNNKLEIVNTLDWTGMRYYEKDPTIDWEKTRTEYINAQEFYKKNKKWPATAFFSLADIFGEEAWFVFFDFDSKNTNREYTDFLGNFGSYLATLKKRRRFSIPILSYALQRDPEQTSAYLNLADVQFDEDVIEWPEIMRHAATLNYREYHKRMVAAGKKDQIPARVLERMK